MASLHPTPTKQKPQRKKWVRFDVDKELGDDPTLPPGLTLFLVEGVAKEKDDAPSHSTPMPVDSPWLPPCTTPHIQEGPSLKSQPNHQLVDHSSNIDQGQKKGWIW